MTREQEKADLDAKLAAAIEEAKGAAFTAVDDFMKASWMVKDGQIYDAAGWASVNVYKPSYKFREALKRLFPKRRGFEAYWTVIGFSDRELPVGVKQSIAAYEIACKAALEVIARHFPAEEFTVISHMD